MFGQRFALALCLSLGFAGAAAAQDSLQNASAAVTDSGRAATDLATSGLQVASAVAVIPVSVAGVGAGVAGSTLHVVGDGSIKAGSDLFAAASDSARFASAPLPVDKAVVVKAQPAPKVPYAANAAPAVPPAR